MVATATSPVPRKNKQQLLSFPEAMGEVMKGRKVTKIAWQNEDYVFLKDGFLQIFVGGEFHTFTIREVDMIGDDWVVVKEMN